MPMANRLLIQVVAQLKPGRCGVSDFAIALATEFKSAFGINTAFVVSNSMERCDSSFPTVYCTQSQLLEACDSLSESQPGTLLVHLSGYGYSSDGAPRELAEALGKAKESGRFRIAVYFHELSATGMPWRSSFWHSRRQKSAIRMIGRESDIVATNLSLHARWLQREVTRGTAIPLLHLPVFSNVGESVAIAPLNFRRSALVVFGLAGTRKVSYKQLTQMGTTLRDLDVDEILDIGPNCDVPSEISGIPVRRMGVLDAAEIHAILSKSKFGFVPHPPHAFAKSGIFAAFSALGTIPVIGKPFIGEVDGLRDGVHLISSRTAESARNSGLENCSTAAWRWYSEHRLHVHAATFARLLFLPSAVVENKTANDASSSENLDNAAWR